MIAVLPKFLIPTREHASTKYEISLSIPSLFLWVKLKNVFLSPWRFVDQKRRKTSLCQDRRLRLTITRKGSFHWSAALNRSSCNSYKMGVWKGKNFLKRREKVFTFHTSNNCTWEIFWEGVWKEKDFLIKKEKVFTFHTSKNCTWDIWKWSPQQQQEEEEEQRFPLPDLSSAPQITRKGSFHWSAAWNIARKIWYINGTFRKEIGPQIEKFLLLQTHFEIKFLPFHTHFGKSFLPFLTPFETKFLPFHTPFETKYLPFHIPFETKFSLFTPLKTVIGWFKVVPPPQQQQQQEQHRVFDLTASPQIEPHTDTIQFPNMD